MSVLGLLDGFETMIKDLLREKKAAIIERWLKDTLATYPGNTSSFFKRETDQFANPVGHALRSGTKSILESLINGIDKELICRHLDEIIKIRAIQDFSPSQAVSFVYLLKAAIRTELSETISNPELTAELEEIDSRIDQIALFAFDIYVRCREQVYELRLNEVKRSVSSIMEKFNNSNSDPEPLGCLSRNKESWQGGGR